MTERQGGRPGYPLTADLAGILATAHHERPAASRDRASWGGSGIVLSSLRRLVSLPLVWRIRRERADFPTRSLSA